MAHDPDRAPSIADRLRGVTVNVRDDLVASRQRFRSGVTYVLRDHVSFATHALSLRDYLLFARLRSGRPLGEIFESLVDEGRLDADDEDRFFAFILDLHRRGLLVLPVADGDALHARYQRLREQRRRGLLTSIFFARVPLADPHEFLERTAWLARPLFTRWALVPWVLLMAIAAAVAWLRRGDLLEPAGTLLGAGNLPLLWILLVALKAIHEFGHAYACTLFGGHVPEMGALFIVGTPCAYVDATDAWSFPERRHRLMVSLGGVYVESIVGALALVGWAFTDPSTLNTALYQTFFLATITTIGFNLNPLMRFDGYFVLGDLLAIPNLRERANRAIGRVLERWAVGVAHPRPRGEGRGLAAFLVGYGASAAVYRVTLILSICTLIATRFYTLGIGLAVVYLLMTVTGTIRRLVQHVREASYGLIRSLRGVAFAVLVGVAPLVAAAAIPVTVPVTIAGAVDAAGSRVVRAPADGVLESLAAPGELVRAGEPVATLGSRTLEAELVVARAEARRAATLQALAIESDPAEAASQAVRRRHAESRVERAQARLAALTVRAPRDLVVLPGDLPPVGRHLAEGAPIAAIAGGQRRVVVPISEAQAASTALGLGTRVSVRRHADVDRRLEGRITALTPVASRQVSAAALTSAAGGAIPLHPERGEAPMAYLELTIELDEPLQFRAGERVVVRLPGQPQTLGERLGAVVRRFLMRIQLS